MPKPIKVLVCDDHALYRKELASFLSEKGFRVSDVPATQKELTRCFGPADRPEIAIVAYKTTNSESLQLISWINRKYPDVKVVMSTLHEPWKYPVAAEAMRIAAVIVKSSATMEDIVETLLDVQAGVTIPWGRKPGPTKKRKPVAPELIQEMESIASFVDTEIVMEVALEVGCHYSTVQKYLAGRVKKEKFGRTLLTTLQQKVKNKQNEGSP